MEAIEVFEILNQSAVDLSKRVAQLDIELTEPFHLVPETSCSFITNTKGDYSLTIILYAENCVFESITKNMKHSDAITDGDILIYAGEFFNILCGHIITAVNNKIHAACKFSVPHLIEGPIPSDLALVEGHRQSLYYRSPCGLLKLEILCPQLCFRSCSVSHSTNA